MIRNDCVKVKLTWNCIIKFQNNNVFKLRGEWSVKDNKINKRWDSQS